MSSRYFRNNGSMMVSHPLFCALVLCACVLVVVSLTGCGGGDPLPERMEEFCYTIGQLADELAGRLSMVQVGQSEREGAKPAVDVDPGRGGDGDRPDPNSLDAIVADAVNKLERIGDDGDLSALADELLSTLASRQIRDAQILGEFDKRLRAQVAKLAQRR